MRTCSDCMHGQRLNWAVRFCEVDETAHKNEHSCSNWEQEDIYQRSAEEMEREDGHRY